MSSLAFTPEQLARTMHDLRHTIAKAQSIDLVGDSSLSAPSWRRTSVDAPVPVEIMKLVALAGISFDHSDAVTINLHQAASLARLAIAECLIALNPPYDLATPEAEQHRQVAINVIKRRFGLL